MNNVPFFSIVAVEQRIPLGAKGDWEIAIGTKADGTRTAEWFRSDGNFHRIVGGIYGENAMLEEEPLLGRVIPSSWQLVDPKGVPFAAGKQPTDKMVGVVSLDDRFSWGNAQQKGLRAEIDEATGLVTVTAADATSRTAYVQFLMWANKARIKGLILVAGADPTRAIEGGERSGQCVVPVLELEDVVRWALRQGFKPEIAPDVLAG